MRTARFIMTFFVSVMFTAQPALVATARAGPGAQAPEALPISVTVPRAAEMIGYMAAQDDEAPPASRTDGLDEEYLDTPGPLAVLPVLDTALEAEASLLVPTDPLRVIVYGAYLPHEAVAKHVAARYATERDSIDTEMGAILARNAERRNEHAVADADNYAGMFEMSATDRQAMRSLHERHEALSVVIRDEFVAAVAPLVHASQRPVVQAIEALGGTVDFTTIAGNIVVAKVPAGSLDKLAATPGVLRVTANRRLESHLDVAAEATLVSAPGLSGGSFWDNNEDGGIYDPAVIDSGTDRDHPALEDNGGRANFWSWYLVDGNADPDFGETCCTEDDWQGHGTHVAGIVASYGCPGYTSHLGMAFGVEKFLTLKAGWLNSSNGRSSMYWADKFNLVERAINNTDGLNPASSYNDDVEGFNLSYGGETTFDDTDGSRFWDSVVSTYADTVVTISAGNDGPSNTLFSDPAVSYNAITVANVQDLGTPDRDDDIIRPSSTRGPTADGRRKPDIGAHGSSITSANAFYESQSDMVAKSGTSMSAPMVLGVAIDLMDAGILDELQVKALLLNTAQKNEPGIDTENDADGWDEGVGWGLMNAWAAYYHRADVRSSEVTPRGTVGSYKLFKGQMRDEGSGGEGRDRATIAWNRHATYNPAAPPSTYYDITRIHMRLIGEDDNGYIDFDGNSTDNVRQVRIGSGASLTDVIVKVYAWSTSFDHGGSTEEFALATEEGFVEVDFPTDFQGHGSWPLEVEPNEEFDLTFWIRNNSDIASHDNTFDLVLPTGFTLVAGADTMNVGSAESGGFSDAHTWTIRAPALTQDGVVISSRHSHDSYLESYGPANWGMGLNVRVDDTAPTPDPMSFSTFPYETGLTSIAMTATNASDLHTPIEYYLQWMSSPSGGTGGTSSGWQSSRSWTDTGLDRNHEYCYRAWARDNAASPNLTAPSPTDCDYTSTETPSGISFGVITTTSIEAMSSLTPSGLTRGSSGLRISNLTVGTNSGWKQDNSLWASTGLSPNVEYAFVARARNGDATETGDSPSADRYTLAKPPAAAPFGPVTDTTIEVRFDANGNPAGTQYNVENTTNGTFSGTITSTSWLDTGLTCETPYNYEVRARNGDYVQTISVRLGVQSTGTCPTTDSDRDGIDDSIDNCTLVYNPDQRDTNGDKIGNICDADLNNTDCIVNFTDLGIMKAVFFTGDPDSDLDGNGTVNFSDLGILKGQVFGPPGPSAHGCN